MYNLTEGANGSGSAILSSRRKFNREKQKEFHVPIVIKDSGQPAMSSTSTLTVVIGDVNDNRMGGAYKYTLAYNYMVSFTTRLSLMDSYIGYFGILSIRARHLKRK